MSDMREPSPVNPLPPVVVALALLIVGVELWLGAGARGFVGGPSAIGWRTQAVQDWGYYPQALDWMWANGRWPLELVKRFVTYPFLHLGFTHALFVCVFLLALGKMVGEVFRPWAVVAVFVCSGIGGALVYSLILSDPRPLVGGYPAVYGLIGAYTFLMWIMAGMMGESRAQAFRLIGFLMGIQLLFAALFGGSNDWVADLGGFATGFGLSFVVSPGGWSRMMARMRR